MGKKQVGLLLTAVMLATAFHCGDCNTQDIAKVESIGSRLEDYESVLRRDSRSVHRSRRVVLNLVEQQEALDIHNNLRRKEGASNVEILTWAPDLAIVADNWAQKCIFQHDTNLTVNNMGQNIYATGAGPPINVTLAIQSWYDEKNYYNYDTQACSAEYCAHYTQVVSALSREVGCAVSNCLQLNSSNLTNALNFICNYRPAGNLEVENVPQRPYKKGPGCSQCETGSWWCNKGLCDRSCSTHSGLSTTTCGCAPVCLNFGSVVNSSCSCSCTPGWLGSNCGVVCENKDPRCDPKPGQFGYPPSYCDHADYRSQVHKLCPLMCKDCQATVGSNGHYTSTKPSLLTAMLIWLSWLLINSFRIM